MAAAVPVNSGRRDWFRILRDLSASGVSMSAVARKCNRQAKAVQHWADGGEPKDSDARVVLALYARHCPLKYLTHQEEFGISADPDAWRDVAKRIEEGGDEGAIAEELDVSVASLRQWLADQAAASSGSPSDSAQDDAEGS